MLSQAKARRNRNAIVYNLILPKMENYTREPEIVN
jgi:hypothetical protein